MNGQLPQQVPAIGSQIRGTHPYCFRSGEWATILLEDHREVDGLPCWLVEFPDGVTDVWVQDDPAAGYEFASSMEKP